MQKQREKEEQTRNTFSPKINQRSKDMVKGRKKNSVYKPRKGYHQDTKHDVGHEQETFKPRINKNSSKLMMNAGVRGRG